MFLFQSSKMFQIPFDVFGTGSWFLDEAFLATLRSGCCSSRQQKRFKNLLNLYKIIIAAVADYELSSKNVSRPFYSTIVVLY